MSFHRDLKREVFQLFGLDGNEPWRFLCDIILGALGTIASLILIALVFEKHPVQALREHGLWPGIALLVAVLLSKYRLVMVLAIIVCVGARGLIVALLYGNWLGLIFAAIGAGAVYVGIRLTRNRSY
jgi:hypothetical protein